MAGDLVFGVSGCEAFEADRGDDSGGEELTGEAVMGWEVRWYDDMSMVEDK